MEQGRGILSFDPAGGRFGFGLAFPHLMTLVSGLFLVLILHYNP
jgi:hypothetical protein